MANDARAAAPGAGAAASPAVAAPTPAQIQAARELFAEATKDEDAGQWDAALAKLQRVSTVRLTAGIRYHVALCEEKLGLTATALAHYLDAAQAAQTENNKEVIDLLREPFLSDLRARVPTLVLHTSADAPGAVMTIDGRPQPSSAWGTPMPVDPGTHRIEASAPGRRRFLREIAMRDRDVTVMDIALPIETPAPAATTVAPAKTKRDDVPAAAPARGGRGLAIATTGGAIVLAGGGVAAFLMAAQYQHDKLACGNGPGCPDTGESRRAVHGWDGVALAAWIGAAALGTAAVVLWARPSHGAKAEGVAQIDVGLGSLRLRGTF